MYKLEEYKNKLIKKRTQIVETISYENEICLSEKPKYKLLREDIVLRMINASEVGIEAMANIYNCPSLPEVWVKESTEVEAESGFNSIFLTEGIINHCIDFSKFDFNLFEEECFPKSTLPHIACASLTWVILHEFTHIFRLHNKALEKFGDTEASRKAIERDADLCSIAAILRLNQNNFEPGKIPFSHLKKYTLFQVFWVIRTLPHNELSKTHLNIGLRLFDILTKLSIMNEVGTETIDIYCSDSKTLESYKELEELLIKMENFFLSKFTKERFGTILPELSVAIKEKKHLSAAEKWDDMRSFIKDITGTKA